MKKFTKFAALAAGLAGLFFAGCNNISNEAATVEGFTKSQAKVLTINVTSDSDLIKFDEPVIDANQMSRSILPGAYTASDVKFFICYKKTGAATFTAAPMEVTFTGTPGANVGDPASTKEGTVTIELPQDSYDLELFAVANESAQASYASEALVKGDACLWATSQADLRYSQPVNFFLSAEGLSRAGSIALKLYAQGWDSTKFAGYDVNAQLLYTKDTSIGANNYTAGTAVTSTDAHLVDATADGTVLISSVIPKDTAPGAANYAKTGVAAGTYLFEITFHKPGAGNPTFYWHDDIKVLPDKATEVEIGIPPTIDVVPSKPASFKAGYIDNLKSEYYKVEFTWDQSAINNESNFKLDLLTIPSAVGDGDCVNPTTDEEWTTLLGKATPAGGTPENKQYQNDFVGDPEVYASGSLGKNSQVATFSLAYGKRYVARICAVNDIGQSDWAYCDLTSGIVADTPAGAVDATKFNSTVINRFKITYNTKTKTIKDKNDADVANVYGCSQNFITADTTVADGASDYFVIEGGTKKYHQYTGGIEIMNPDGKTDFNYDLLGAATTVEKPLLKLNATQTWTNWTNNDANWNEIGSLPKPYGGFENLELVANFATQAKVTLFDDKDYAIASVEATSVTLDTDDGESHYVVTWAQSTVTDEIWTIEAPTGVIYDYVTVKLYRTNNEKDYYSVAVTYDAATKKYKATLPVSQYRTGIYRAEIAAYSPVRKNDPYTAQIGVIITD